VLINERGGAGSIAMRVVADSDTQAPRLRARRTSRAPLSAITGKERKLIEYKHNKDISVYLTFARDYVN
jgi:hypothetical protein